MDLLGLFYTGIGILLIVGIGTLFFVKKEKFINTIMIAITVVLIITTLLSISSMPSNFILEKIVAGVIGIVSLVGCGMRFGYKNHTFLPKVLVAISVIGTYVFMLFFMR